MLRGRPLESGKIRYITSRGPFPEAVLYVLSGKVEPFHGDADKFGGISRNRRGAFKVQTD
jgi:hypothetical protein